MFFRGIIYFLNYKCLLKINIHIERHHGVVVRALTCGEEGPWIENCPQSCERKTLSVHPAANRYPTLFRAGWVGKVKAAKGEEIGTTLHMLCPLTRVKP